MSCPILKQFVRPDLQAHIYSDALLNNLKQLRSLCSPTVKFCAVVKADAYGHGIAEVVSILKSAEVDFFAVANIFEACHIAELLDSRPVLIFDALRPDSHPEQIVLSARSNFHCTIASSEAAEHASKTLAGTDYTLNLHVSVETGMGRSGLSPNEAQTLISKIDRAPNLALAGVYTHFATADEQNLSFAYKQLDAFNKFLAQAHLRSRKDVLIHAANSAATIKLPESHFDMVRCGISLYGYFSHCRLVSPINLMPVMKLQSPIVHIKKLPEGHCVSYGLSFITKRDTVVATIPLGYADGYRRCFSNRAKMKIGQTPVPVIGRVCMDQLLLDVTDLPDVHLRQLVTVIDNSHDSPCSAYALADLADTICYEILATVPAHITRVVH